MSSCCQLIYIVVYVQVGVETVETTKTGPIQVLPTLSEAEAGDCITSTSVSVQAKKKKKPDKPAKSK